MLSRTTALLCTWAMLLCSAVPAQSECYDRSACNGCLNTGTAPKIYVFDCCLGNVTEKKGPNQYAGYVWSYPNITQSPASTFSILDAAAGSTFIVATNGTLWTNKSLDWNQTMCWVFAIEVTTGGNHQTVIVAVGVIDINEYPPVFNGLPAIVNTSVTRNARGVSSLCYTITDRDAYSGSYGNVPTVRIVAGDSGGLFEVTIGTISQQLTSACITNTGSLDGRNASRYNLTLLASDQGTPPLSSTTWIVIQLTGINYYAPVFTPLQPLGPLVLRDNTAYGTIIQTFVATDNDTGDNGKVEYSIQSPQTSPPQFRINATSGALVLNSPFALATPQYTYTVCVTATDMSPTFPLSSSICTDVTVIPSSPPETKLQISPNAPPYCLVSIAENVWNTTVNNFIFLSFSGDIRCTILHGVANFTVVSSSLGGNFYQCFVTVNGFLDYEKASQLNITLGVTWNIALPSDSFGLYDNYTCTVNVVDSNDNAPQLNGTHFAFEERQTLGSYVAQLTGYDLDHSSTNGMIALYLLVGVHNATTDLTSLNLFNLDPMNGLITTKALIERRKVGKSLNITVNVTDGGSPPLSSIIIVQLDVIGAFTAKSYSFFLFKNVPAPVTVGRVEVMVSDVSNISYQLEMSSTFFVVDTRGNVTALVPFGSEGVYEFKVLASDHGSFSVSSTAMVTVIVLDICSNVCNLTVRSTATVGQSLGRVLRDSVGTTLNYRILNSSDVFDIDLNSGMVKVKSVPLLSPSYTLVFAVFNPIFTAVSTQCSVGVLVLDPPSNVTNQSEVELIIGASIGPALFMVLFLCALIIAFHCSKRRHRGKLPILRPDSVRLSVLTGSTRETSPPKSILSPVASPTHTAKGNGVKFMPKAEEFLVNQEESVDKADTSIKKYSNVKFSNSPQMAPRSQPAIYPPDLSSPPSGGSNLPPPHSPSSSETTSAVAVGAPLGSGTHSLLYPIPHPPSMTHRTRGYPPTHEDMLDHSLATHTGHSHHLSDANSGDDCTYSDNTSIRNTAIPCFKGSSDKPLTGYVDPRAVRGSSPPSFLPPSSARSMPPTMTAPASFVHREYLTSPTPPQHSSSSHGSTPPPRGGGGGGYPLAPPIPQMVPQPGSPPTYMPSALDHSEMDSMTESRYSLTESYLSAALDDVLRFPQDDIESDVYNNLTYNEDGSEL